MKKQIVALLAGALMMMGMANAAYAIPALQLDIVGGTYNSATQTIIAPGNSFTLNALLKPDTDNLLGDTYFISAALLPSTNVVANYGSFKINSQTYNVTTDMVYGTPPLDAAYPNLGPHGIFDDFYKELGFTFPTLQYGLYNSQDSPGSTPTSGIGMYVNSFTIDISGLNKDLGLHFDLYNENLKTKKRGVVDYTTQFAPYSHDAEGMRHDNPPPAVPEPGTMALLGFGMLGLAIFGKRRMNKEA